MTLLDSTRDFARRMALQSIDHWRKAKAAGLPKSAAYSRRYALFLLHAYKTGRMQ